MTIQTKSIEQYFGSVYCAIYEQGDATPFQSLDEVLLTIQIEANNQSALLCGAVRFPKWNLLIYFILV